MRIYVVSKTRSIEEQVVAVQTVFPVGAFPDSRERVAFERRRAAQITAPAVSTVRATPYPAVYTDVSQPKPLS
jgi:hypothetical protein